MTFTNAIFTLTKAKEFESKMLLIYRDTTVIHNAYESKYMVYIAEELLLRMLGVSIVRV